MSKGAGNPALPALSPDADARQPTAPPVPGADLLFDRDLATYLKPTTEDREYQGGGWSSSWAAKPAKPPQPPQQIMELLKSLRALHWLCWGLDEFWITKKDVFFEEDVEIPAEAKDATRISFMDLRKHSEYDSAHQQAGRCLLLGGVESFTVYPAYKKIFEQATYLNARYTAFKPGQELQPPLRNMLVTGISDIRRSCCNDYILMQRLAGKQMTVIQPRALKRKGYFRFDGEGVAYVRADSADELMKNMRNKEVWALIDDEPLDEFVDHRTHDWLFLWTAGAKDKTSRWGREARAKVLDVGSEDWVESGATRA